MLSTKYCNRCRQTLTVDNFNKGTAPDGLHGWCKSCNKAYKQSKYVPRPRKPRPSQAQIISQLPAVVDFMGSLAKKNNRYVDKNGEIVAVNKMLSKIVGRTIPNILSHNVLKLFKVPKYQPPQRQTSTVPTYSLLRVEYRSRHLIRWHLLDQYSNCMGVFTNHFDARLELKRLEAAADLDSQAWGKLYHRHTKKEDQDNDLDGGEAMDEPEGDDESENDLEESEELVEVNA